MSDGRFAVLGGTILNHTPLSSCEALVFGDDGRWEALPQMHITWAGFHMRYSRRMHHRGWRAI